MSAQTVADRLSRSYRRWLVTLGAVPLAVLAVGLVACSSTTARPPAAAPSPFSGRWQVVAAAPTGVVPSGTLLFRTVSGQMRMYQPPASLPAGIIWQTYTNQKDGFSVDVPATWVVTKTQYNGHEGLAIYPAGTNPASAVPGGPPGIGIGWTDAYQTPGADDLAIADLQPVAAGPIWGQEYTVDALAPTMIAAFPRTGGTLVMSGDAQSDLLILVFQHMLASLKLS